MPPSSVRVRFAPSPTGHLHLGNVRTALFNWLFARNRGGTFILRLEDTDAARSTEESVASVLEDLRWLGLAWDEGPEAGGAFGPYRQTERYSLYRRYIERLLAEDKAYPCYCTPEELDAGRERAKAAGRTYTYPGTCSRLSPAQRRKREEEGENPSIRLRVPPETVTFTDLVRGPMAIHAHQFGDWIIARPDGSPTYNFAVVVDDALMEVTHVIRGEDHLSNTPKQVALYQAMGLPVPSFAHLSMILGPDGGKLSKRHGHVSVDALRDEGFLPAAVVNGLALMGWSDPEEREILSREELTAAFDLGRVHKAAAVYDDAKFRFLNKEHLKKLEGDALVRTLHPWLSAGGRVPPDPISREEKAWTSALAELVRQRIDLLSEAVPASDPVFLFSPETMTEEARGTLDGPEAGKVLEAFLAKVLSTDMSEPGAYREAVLAIRDELGVKGKALFHPIRVGLTASESGPDLERLVPLLEAGSRLDLPTPVLSPAERIRRVLALIA